jgi:carboxypeptidase C (cathepsin A)
MYEQGPFHVSETNHSELYHNPYTWAGLVNIIFLESPAGVGFSYSSNNADYSTNDTQTANDNFAFLQWFFTTGYPEFATNDFYIGTDGSPCLCTSPTRAASFYAPLA